MIRGLAKSAVTLLLLSCAVVAVVQAQGTRRAQLVWTSADTDVLIGRPLGLYAADDGTLWVSDPGSGLHRFAASGQYLGTAGRMGDGPGEWRFPWALASPEGQRVFLADPRLRRLSVYRMDGTFERSVRFPFSNVIHGELDGLGIAGKAILMWSHIRPTGAPRANEGRAYVWRMSEGETAFDSIVAMAGPESVMHRGERTSSRVDAPFRRRSWVMFAGDSLITAHNGTGTIATYDLTGREVSHFDVSLPHLRVTEAHRRSYLDSVSTAFEAELARMRYGPEMRRIFRDRNRELMKKVQFPESWQLFDYALLGDSGTLWLALPSPEKDYARDWVALNADGEVVARTRVPHAGSVVAAVMKGDHLYVSEFNWPGEEGRIAAYLVP